MKRLISIVLLLLFVSGLEAVFAQIPHTPTPEKQWNQAQISHIGWGPDMICPSQEKRLQVAPG